MTAGAFSEHLDDSEALMSALEEGPSDPTLCYYYCFGTEGGQALLSLTPCLFLKPSSPPVLLSFICPQLLVLFVPFDTFFILQSDLSPTYYCK